MEHLANVDSGNADWQHDLAISYARIALIKTRQGARRDALKAFQQGRDIIVQLILRLPDDATLPKGLAWFDRQIQMSTHEK